MNTAVILKYSGEYFNDKIRTYAYTQWLTVNQIPHTFITTPSTSDIPSAILLNGTDAVAFKLRFGL